MLSVEHITKKYKDFTVLKDINLTFENGVYGLIAPNGAGKTTLIKMIVTLLRPTQGIIRWDGEDIWKLELLPVRLPALYLRPQGPEPIRGGGENSRAAPARLAGRRGG